MKNTDPKRFYEIGKKTWNDFNKQFPTYNDFQKLMDEDPENLENFDILVKRDADPNLYKQLINPEYNPKDDPVKRNRNLMNSDKNSDSMIRSPYYNVPTNNLSYAPITIYADNTYKLPLKPVGKEVSKEDYGPASPKDAWSDFTAFASQFTKVGLNALYQPLLNAAREGSESPNYDRGGRGTGTLRTPKREVERANKYEAYQNSNQRLVAYKNVVDDLTAKGKNIDKFLGHDPTKTSFFGDVFGGLGTSAAIFLSGAITRNPLIPLMIGAQAESTSFAVDVFEANKDLPLKERVARSEKAEFFGMGVGWTEALPMGKLGEFAANKVGKTLFKEGVEEGVEKSFKGYAGTGFDKLFKRKTSDLGVDLTFGKMNVTHAITEEMMDEGLQEVLQGTLEEGAKALGLVDNHKFDLASVMYQGLVGSVSGGVMGGTTAKTVNTINTETRQANMLNKAKVEMLGERYKKGEISEGDFLKEKEQLKKQSKEEKIRDLIDYRLQKEVYGRSQKAVAHIAKNGWTSEPEVQKIKTYIQNTKFYKDILEETGSETQADEQILSMFKAGEVGLDFQDKIALEIMNKQESEELSKELNNLSIEYGFSPSLGQTDNVSPNVEKNLQYETSEIKDDKGRVIHSENKYLDEQGNTLIVSKGKKGAITKVTLNGRKVTVSKDANLINIMSKLNFKPLAKTNTKGKVFIAKQDEKLYSALPDENKVILEDNDQIKTIIEEDNLKVNALFEEKKKVINVKYDDKRKRLVSKIKSRSTMFQQVDEIASKRNDFIGNPNIETYTALEQEMSKQGDDLNVLIKHRDNPKLTPEQNLQNKVDKARNVIRQIPFSTASSQKFIKLSNDPQKSLDAYTLLRSSAFLAYSSYLAEDFDMNVVPDILFSVSDNYQESKNYMLEYTQLIDDSFKGTFTNEETAKNIVERINSLYQKIYQSDKEVAKVVKENNIYKVSVLGYVNEEGSNQEPFELTDIDNYFVTVPIDKSVVTLSFRKWIKFIEYQFYNKFDKTISGRDTLTGNITKVPSPELQEQWELQKFAVIKTTVENFLRRNPVFFNKIQNIEQSVSILKPNSNESIAMYYLNILKQNKYSDVISAASKSSSVSKLMNLFEQPVSVTVVINNEEKEIEAPTVWHAILLITNGMEGINNTLSSDQVLQLSNFNARELALKFDIAEYALILFQDIIDQNWSTINSYKEAFDILKSTYGVSTNVFDIMIDYVGVKQMIESDYERIFNQETIKRVNGKFTYTRNQLVEVLALQSLYPKAISFTDKNADIFFEESQTSNFDIQEFLVLKDSVFQLELSDLPLEVKFGMSSFDVTTLPDLTHYSKIVIKDSAGVGNLGDTVSRRIKSLYPDKNVTVDRRSYDFELNSEQREASDTIKQALLSKRSMSNFVLIGNAGTGKSTVIAQTIQEFIYEKLAMGESPFIIVATPTHKAKKVVSNFIDKLDPSIKDYIGFFTVTQLKEERLEASSNDFVRGRNPQVRMALDRAQGVFIDETSMLGINDFNEIRSKTTAPMIFIGDDAQLRPVGSNSKSPIFSLSSAKTLKLTTITRQNIDNPIIKKAQYIRENPLKNDYPLVDEVNETGGIQYVDGESSLVNVITNALLAGKNAIALAFTNATVDRLNAQIRNIFFNSPQTEDIVIGDRILFGGRILGGLQVENQEMPILYNNGDMVVVDKIEENEEEFSMKVSMSEIDYNLLLPMLEESGIFTNVRYERSQRKGDYNGIYVSFKSTHSVFADGHRFKYLHESNKGIYDSIRKVLNQAKQARDTIYRQQMSYQERRTALDTNLQIKLATLLNPYLQSVMFSPKAKFEGYNTVKYGYAATVHKSQGSTYEVVAMHEDDMEMIHKDVKDKQQGKIEVAERKYTAYTRSSGMVYVYKSGSKTKTTFNKESFIYPYPKIDFKGSKKVAETRTTKEGIDISNTKGKKSPYFEKDQKKFSKANKFIGYGEEGTSSRGYAEAVKPTQLNTGTYTKDDVVGVTVNGGVNADKDFARVKVEVSKVIQAGATIIADNVEDRNRDYNKGERLLAEYLQANGYKENNGVWQLENASNNAQEGQGDTNADEGIVSTTEEEIVAPEQYEVEDTNDDYYIPERETPKSGSYLNFRNVLYLSANGKIPDNVKGKKVSQKVGKSGIEWSEVDIVIYDENNVTAQQRDTIKKMREFGTADVITIQAYNDFISKTKDSGLSNIEVVPVDKSYQARTEENAKNSIVTIALYNNNSSPGEILTKKLAEKHKSTYVPVNLNTIVSESELQFFALTAYKAIYEKVLYSETPIEEITINIAGNGLVHLKMSQESADRLVAEFMDRLMSMLDQDIRKGQEIINLKNFPIKILTGMQEGIDQAGAKWALANNVNLKVHIPSDYRTNKLTGSTKNYFAFWKSLLPKSPIQFKEADNKFVSPQEAYEKYMAKDEKISEWVDFVETTFEETKIQVVDSNFILPNGVKIGTAKGAYSLYSDTIYLNKENINSPQDFYRQYGHELTHRFLVRLLSGKTKNVSFYNGLLKLGNDIFDSLSQTELYQNNKAAFDIIFQHKDVNNDVFVNELVAHLMSGTSILRDYTDTTEYTEGTTFKQRFHKLLRTIVQWFAKQSGKKPTFQKALDELLAYHVDYKTPHSILEQAKITYDKNLPDGVLTALSTFHISDSAFNPVTLQSVALAIAEKNKVTITDHIEYLKSFTKEQLKNEILSLPDYKISLEILHKNSKKDITFSEFIDKKILSLYTRLANISLKKMVRMYKEAIYDDQGDVLEINGKPQFSIRTQELPVVFEDFYGAKQSSYKENRVIERTIQMLSDYFGTPIEAIYLEQFWTKNNLDAYNVTPWSLVKNNDIINQLYDPNFVWIGNFGALETNIMLKFPEGKPADFAQKINEAQLVMEANGSLLDFEEIESNQYLSSMVRWMIEDIRLGGIYTKDQQKSSLFTSNAKSDAIKILKRAYDLSPEQKIALNETEKRDLYDSVENKIGITYENGEILFNAFIFDSEQSQGMASVEIDGKTIDFNIQDILVNAFGKETTDGIIYYLANGFDTIYRKGFGSDKDGPIKAWASNIGDMKPLFLKSSYQGLYNPNDLIYQWMEQNNISILISSSSAKVNDYGISDISGLINNEIGDKIVQLPLGMFNRITEKDTINKEAIGLSSGFTRNIYSQYNPIFGDNEFNVALSNVLERLSKKTQSQLSSFQGANIMEHLVKLLENESFSNLELTVSKMILSIINEESIVTQDIYQVMNDSQKIDQDAKKLEVYKKLSNIFHDPFFAQILQQYVKDTLDDYFAYKMPSRNAVIRPDLGYLEASNINLVISNIKNEINQELKEDWDNLQIKGSKEVLSKIDELKVQITELKDKYAKQDKIVKKLSNTIETANLVYEHKALKDKIDSLIQEVKDLRENNQAIKEYQLKRGKLKREKVREIIEENSGRLNEGFAYLSPEIANEMLGSDKIKSFKEIKNQDKVKEYESKTTPELFNEVLFRATNKYTSFTNQAVKGINLDKSDNQIVSKFLLHQAILDGKTMAKHKFDIFNTTYKTDKIQAYNEFKALWIKYIENNPAEFEQLMNLLETTVVDGQTLPLISNAPSDLSHAKILSELINETKDNEVDERDFTELNEDETSEAVQTVERQLGYEPVLFVDGTIEVKKIHLNKKKAFISFVNKSFGLQTIQIGQSILEDGSKAFALMQADNTVVYLSSNSKEADLLRKILIDDLSVPFSKFEPQQASKELKTLNKKLFRQKLIATAIPTDSAFSQRPLTIVGVSDNMDSSSAILDSKHWQTRAGKDYDIDTVHLTFRSSVWGKEFDQIVNKLEEANIKLIAETKKIYKEVLGNESIKEESDIYDNKNHIKYMQALSSVNPKGANTRIGQNLFDLLDMFPKEVGMVIGTKTMFSTFSTMGGKSKFKIKVPYHIKSLFKKENIELEEIDFDIDATDPKRVMKASIFFQRWLNDQVDKPTSVNSFHYNVTNGSLFALKYGEDVLQILEAEVANFQNLTKEEIQQIMEYIESLNQGIETGLKFLYFNGFNQRNKRHSLDMKDDKDFSDYINDLRQQQMINKMMDNQQFEELSLLAGKYVSEKQTYQRNVRENKDIVVEFIKNLSFEHTTDETPMIGIFNNINLGDIPQTMPGVWEYSAWINNFKALQLEQIYIKKIGDYSYEELLRLARPVNDEFIKNYELQRDLELYHSTALLYLTENGSNLPNTVREIQEANWIQSLKAELIAVLRFRTEVLKGENFYWKQLANEKNVLWMKLNKNQKVVEATVNYNDEVGHFILKNMGWAFEQIMKSGAVIFRSNEYILNLAERSKVLTEKDFVAYKNNLNEEIYVMKEFEVPNSNGTLFVTPTVDGKVVFTYKEGKNNVIIENFKDLERIDGFLDLINNLSEIATAVPISGKQNEVSIKEAKETQEFFYKLSVLIDFARSIPSSAKVTKAVELIKEHSTKGKQDNLYLMLSTMMGNPNATQGNTLNGLASPQNEKTPFYSYPNNNTLWEVLSRVSPELTKRMMKDISNTYPMDNFDKQQSLLRNFDEDGYIDLWFSETEKLPSKLNIYNYFVEGDEIKKRMGLWTAQDSFMEIIRNLRKDVFHTRQAPLDELGNIDYNAELAKVPVYHSRKKAYKSVTFNNVINAYSGSEYGAPLKSYNPEMLVYAQVTEWQKIMRQNQFQRENQQNIQLDKAIDTLSEVYKEGYFGRGKARDRAYIETVRYVMTNNDDILIEITDEGKTRFRLDDIDQTFYGTNESFESPKKLVSFLASKNPEMTKEDIFLLESSLYIRQKIALDIYYLENMINFLKDKATEYENVSNFYNYYTQVAIPSLEDELKAMKKPNFYPVYLSRADLKAYFAKLDMNDEYKYLVDILESKGIKDGIFLHKLMKIVNNPFNNFAIESSQLSQLSTNPDFANFNKSNGKGLKKFQDKLYGHIQNEYLYSLWLDYVYKKSVYGKYVEVDGVTKFVSNYDEMIMGKMKTFLGLMSNHQHFARKIVPISEVKEGDEVSFMYNHQIIDEVTQEVRTIKIPVYGIVNKIVGTRIYTERIQKKIQVPKELEADFETQDKISLEEAIAKVIQTHERMIEKGVDQPITDNQKQFILDLISDGYLDEEIGIVLDALDMAQASAYISQAYQVKLNDIFAENGFETVNIEAPVVEEREEIVGYKTQAKLQDVTVQTEKLQSSGYVMLMNRRSPIAEKANLGFKIMLLVQSGLMLGGFKIANWMDGTSSLMSDLSLVPHAQVFSQYTNFPFGRQSKKALNNLLSSADNIETYREFLDEGEVDQREVSEAKLAELIAYKYCISNDIGVQGVTGAMIKEYENEGIIEKLGMINKALLWSFRKQEEAIRKKGAFYYAYKAIHIDKVTNIEEIEEIVSKGVSRTQSMYEAMYRRLAESKDVFKWMVQFSQYGHYQWELFKIDKDISKEIGEKFKLSLLMKSLIFGESSINPNRKVKYAKRFINDLFFYWTVGVLMPGLRSGHPLSRLILLGLKLGTGYAIAAYDDDDKKRSWTDLFYALFSIAFGVGITIPLTWLKNEIWKTDREQMAMNEDNRTNMATSFNTVQLGTLLYNVAVEPLVKQATNPEEKLLNELYGSNMERQAGIWSTLSYSTSKVFGLNVGGYPTSYFKGKEQTLRNLSVLERLMLLTDGKALKDLTYNYFNPNWVEYTDPYNISNIEKMNARRTLIEDNPGLNKKRVMIDANQNAINAKKNAMQNIEFLLQTEKNPTKIKELKDRFNDLDILIRDQQRTLDSLKDIPYKEIK